MTVAVAHHGGLSNSAKALESAAQEASLRNTPLAVIHVVDSLDSDIAAANQAGISDAIDNALAHAGLGHIAWDLHLVAGGTQKADVATAILEQADTLKPEVLVIGARRRTPVGKAFLGSIAQTILLDSEYPVLVVKDNH